MRRRSTIPRMGRGRGLAAAATCAAAFVTVPAAHASQGTDSITRGDYVGYTADPGEANRVTIEPTPDGGLHLNDAGAIIRWLGAPVPGVASCGGAVHDVLCLGTGGGFGFFADLGDGDDTYKNTATTPGEIDLGPGDDTAVGGQGTESFDGGPGADDIHGGAPSGDEAFSSMWPEQVTYEHATGPVSVTADDVANDGVAGEHDNIHGDIEGIVGGPFDDTITGFYAAQGGDGNDVLTGGPGSNRLYGDAGDDTFQTRDGEAEHIWCGPGVDTVVADAADVIETPGDCEDVQIG